MSSDAEGGFETTTRKKGVVHSKKYPSCKDDEAYTNIRAIAREKNHCGFFPLSNSTEETAKGLKGKRLKSGSIKCEKSFTYQDQFEGPLKSNQNIYARNLGNFSAPGEINCAKTDTKYCLDWPVHAERDLASVFKNFPDSLKDTSNINCLYSTEPLRTFSNAPSMLTNQHAELNEKYLKAQRNISKLDGRRGDDYKLERQICPKILKVTKMKQPMDSSKHIDEIRPEMEMMDSSQFSKKLDDIRSLNSSDFENYLENIKLHELNEDELRELYEISTSDLTEISKSDHHLDLDHTNEETVQSKSHLEKERSKICSKSQTSSNLLRKNSKMSARNLDRRNFAYESKKLKNERYKQQNDGKAALKTAIKTTRCLSRRSAEILTIKSKYPTQKTQEVEAMIGLKHSAGSRIEMTQSSNQNSFCQRLKSEIISCGHLNQGKPDMARLNMFQPERSELERGRHSHKKSPTEELTDGLSLNSKSSIHFCQMIAKNLPDAKVIPFDKLSKILPETELTKINEKINKNMEEKQFLPGLLEDTQLHIDRIKQQVLRKAKECLPNATFSKINHFLSNNKSKNCHEPLLGEKPKMARSSPSLITKPRQKITCQEPKTVSRSHQRRSSRSSAASFHGEDGTRWQKFGHKSLTKSNSYYDYLYSVYDDGKQRQSRKNSRLMHSNESKFDVKTTQPKSSKTVKRNTTKEPHSSRFDRKLGRSVSVEDFLKVCLNCNEYVVKCVCTSDSPNFNSSIVCDKSENRRRNNISDYDHRLSCNKKEEQGSMEVHRTSNKCDCKCNYSFDHSYRNNHSPKECDLDGELFNPCFGNFDLEDSEKLDCEDVQKCLLNTRENLQCALITCNSNSPSSIEDCSFKEVYHISVKANGKSKNLDSYDYNQNLLANRHLSVCDCRLKHKTLSGGGDYNFCKNSHINTNAKLCSCNNLNLIAGRCKVLNGSSNFNSCLKNENSMSFCSPKITLNKCNTHSSISEHFSCCNSSFGRGSNKFDPAAGIYESLNQLHEIKQYNSFDKSYGFYESNHQSSHCKPNLSNFISSSQEDEYYFNRDFESGKLADSLEKHVVESNLVNYYPDDSACQNCQVNYSWNTDSCESDSEDPLASERSRLPKKNVPNYFDQLENHSELWYGLYEPTTKENDDLNAQYYLHLAKKLLNSELFGSVTTNKLQVKQNLKTFLESCNFIDVREVTSSDKPACQKSKLNLDSFYCFNMENRCTVSFCASHLQRNSKLIKLSKKSICRCKSSAKKFRNGAIKIKSYKRLNLGLKRYFSIKNDSRLKERICKYSISKYYGELICLHRTLRKPSASEILKAKRHFTKQSILSYNDIAFLIKISSQERLGTSVTEQKSHLESITHSDILVHVPEITPFHSRPLFLNQVKYLERLANPCQNILAETKAGKATLGTLCTFATDSDTQSLRKNFYAGTSLVFFGKSYKFQPKYYALETAWQSCNSQELDSSCCSVLNYVHPLIVSTKGHEQNSTFMSLTTFFFQPLKNNYAKSDTTFSKFETQPGFLNVSIVKEFESIFQLDCAMNFSDTNLCKLEVILDHQPKMKFLKIWHSNQIFKSFSTFSSPMKSQEAQNLILHYFLEVINFQLIEIVPHSLTKAINYEVQKTLVCKLDLKKSKKEEDYKVPKRQNRTECKSKIDSHAVMDFAQKYESVFHSLEAAIKLVSQHFCNYEFEENFYLEKLNHPKKKVAPLSPSAKKVFKILAPCHTANQSRTYTSPNSTFISGPAFPSFRKGGLKQVITGHQHFARKPPLLRFFFQSLPETKIKQMTTSHLSAGKPSEASHEKESNILMSKYHPFDSTLVNIDSCNPDSVLCSFKPVSYDQLDMKIPVFYLLCLLTRWQFEYYSWRQVKNRTFSKNPTQKNSKSVNCVTQTDLSLMNSELFDAFLLSRILSFDDNTDYL